MIDGIPVLLVGWCLVSGALINAFAVVFIIAWVLFKLFGERKPRDGWNDILPYPRKDCGVKPPNEGTSGVKHECRCETCEGWRAWRDARELRYWNEVR